MTQPSAPDSAPSYEQARDELVQIVQRLESGGAPLDESLALWERGEKLAVDLPDLAGRREGEGRCGSPRPGSGPG